MTPELARLRQAGLESFAADRRLLDSLQTSCVLTLRALGAAGHLRDLREASADTRAEGDRKPAPSFHPTSPEGAGDLSEAEVERIRIAAFVRDYATTLAKPAEAALLNALAGLIEDGGV